MAEDGDALTGYAPMTAGSITVNVYAANLRDNHDRLMSERGLVFLAVDTLRDGFSSPESDSFFKASDDYILAKWDLSAVGSGQLAETTASISLASTPGWDALDPLCLYWYPTLEKSSNLPGQYGISYGQYRHDTGLDGSSPWLTPSPGSTIDLKFFTEDLLYDGIHSGSNPSSSARASMTVVPEPEKSVVIAGAICLLWALKRHHHK